MGANFINTVLEIFSGTIQNFFKTSPLLLPAERELDVIMSILSNYTPDCVVKVWVECPITELGDFAGDIDSITFAERFYHAIRMGLTLWHWLQAMIFGPLKPVDIHMLHEVVLIKA